LTVRAALGESPDIRPRATGESAVVRFLVGPPGRIAAIGMPLAEPGEGIAGAGLWVKPGDEVLPRSSSKDRLGYVVASGPTSEIARRRAEGFLARVRVEYESVPKPFAEEEIPCRAAS
jgi:argininosuccinate lyase